MKKLVILSVCLTSLSAMTTHAGETALNQAPVRTPFAHFILSGEGEGNYEVFEFQARNAASPGDAVLNIVRSDLKAGQSGEVGHSIYLTREGISPEQLQNTINQVFKDQSLKLVLRSEDTQEPSAESPFGKTNRDNLNRSLNQRGFSYSSVLYSSADKLMVQTGDGKLVKLSEMVTTTSNRSQLEATLNELIKKDALALNLLNQRRIKAQEWGLVGKPAEIEQAAIAQDANAEKSLSDQISTLRTQIGAIDESLRPSSGAKTTSK